MKVLVAEDDRVSAQALRLVLEMDGHEVLVAPNGQEAFELVQAHVVNVILSDWNMPKMDGLELCKHVRQLGSPEYIYFVLLTGVNLGRENLRVAMEAGVDDFLSKPLDRELLLMRLSVAERILEQTRQIRTLRSLIPICMYCKRIRDDKDYWQQVEAYLREQTGSEFSHGVCPDCFAHECGTPPPLIAPLPTRLTRTPPPSAPSI